MGKLHKTKTKEIPAPAGGTAKTRFSYKLKVVRVRDQPYRLRKHEYGETKEWVALRAQPKRKEPAAAAASAPKRKATKTKK